MAKIDIWEPRWKDRVVLIAKHKVGQDNHITFSRAKSLPGIYYMSGEQIRTYPLGTNGKTPCYEVPLAELTKEEENE